ncbi:hypothetical protein BJ138DRAFT_980503, partial [Hygrophoropsis aurantiaca]
EAHLKRCSGCKKGLALDHYPIATKGKGKGLPTATCHSCSVRKSTWNKQKYQEMKDDEKENFPDGYIFPNSGHTLGILSITDFLSILGTQGNCLELEARVNISSISPN